MAEGIIASEAGRAAAMSTAATENDPFAQAVQASLNVAQAHASRARRTDIILFIVMIVAPAAATLIAALAAVAGGNNLFPQATGVDDGGWKLACALAAGFSFIAALGSAFKERVDKQVEQSKACVGRLMALNVALALGHLSREQLMKDYADVMNDHAEWMK
jgi:Ni/Fe-hydrogenase subunit HybB-like protein